MIKEEEEEKMRVFNFKKERERESLWKNVTVKSFFLLKMMMMTQQ